MKEKDFWAKAIYCGYGVYTNVFDRLQAKIESIGTEFMSRQDVFSQADKICALIERREKLINLKLYSEHLFSVVSDNEHTTLMLKFTEGDSFEQIAESLHIAKSTVYSRCRNAINKINDELINSGIQKILESDYVEEKNWLAQLLAIVESKE